MPASDICSELAVRSIARRESLDRLDEVVEAVAAGMRQAAGLGTEEPVADSALERIVSLLGCSVVEADHLRSDLGGPEAMLVTGEPGVFWVLVDPRPAGGWRATGNDRVASVRRRARFRILHEAAHTLFASSDQAAHPTDAEVEETFCDRFAAAILLPPSLVRSARPDATTAYALCEEYDVSAHLVARAFAHHHADVLSVSLLVENDLRPRVQWTTDQVAAQAAVEELHGRPCARNVDWATRGTQSLRIESAAS